MSNYVQVGDTDWALSVIYTCANRTYYKSTKLKIYRWNSTVLLFCFLKASELLCKKRIV